MKSTKEEMLQKLREDPNFKKILSKSSSDSERRAIKAYTEDFLVRFYKNLYEPLATAAEKDPNSLRNECMKMNEILVKSGSIDVIMERDGRPEKPRT